MAGRSCNIAVMNWENLKYLLAFYRSGSLTDAAEHLNVDATTVSRHLAALQSETGIQLVEKSADGSLELTAAGLRAVEHSETAETALARLEAELTGAGMAEEGTVRISSVPMVINRILMPEMKQFTAQHPAIELHLASEVRNVSLTRRETDMAIRLGRPKEGGYKVKARRIAVLKHAAFGPRQETSEELPWIIYHKSTSFLPQARWMAENISADAAEISSVRPSDLEGVIEAVAAGLGRSIIPVRVAEADRRLRRLSEPKPDLLREVWLLQHADQVGLARMTAVSRWLEKIFSTDLLD
ncbi:MAG: LysR family transcriptional regulator [Roseibium sp.]|uniref:LysR family transcriptional regulator n=1 Tax=Roseibium sp. TaxID=1936156 RepID=UPI002606ADCE|nr:LysR family transcriptional regulator [Roseibium sp.]MCV0427718.1 LysR family transcriptional regulator [Roseibium sp.]